MAAKVTVPRGRLVMIGSCSVIAFDAAFKPSSRGQPSYRPIWLIFCDETYSHFQGYGHYSLRASLGAIP